MKSLIKKVFLYCALFVLPLETIAQTNNTSVYNIAFKKIEKPDSMKPLGYRLVISANYRLVHLDTNVIALNIQKNMTADLGITYSSISILNKSGRKISPEKYVITNRNLTRIKLNY